MVLKKLIFILLFFSTSIFAHRVAGVDTSIEKKQNNKIHIKAFFQKSKKPIFGNEVKLISMFDNRVLDRGKLKHDGLVLNIPQESYWVYVLYRDNDIVKNGLEPDNGFKKEIQKNKIAFLYTILISLLFIFSSFFIGFRRSKKFKRSLS